jgi:hypothetical protein
MCEHVGQFQHLFIIYLFYSFE